MWPTPSMPRPLGQLSSQSIPQHTAVSEGWQHPCWCLCPSPPPEDSFGTWKCAYLQIGATRKCGEVSPPPAEGESLDKHSRVGILRYVFHSFSTDFRTHIMKRTLFHFFKTIWSLIFIFKHQDIWTIITYQDKRASCFMLGPLLLWEKNLLCLSSDPPGADLEISTWGQSLSWEKGSTLEDWVRGRQEEMANIFFMHH